LLAFLFFIIVILLFWIIVFTLALLIFSGKGEKKLLLEKQGHIK
jgi:hypothetical protein